MAYKQKSSGLPFKELGSSPAKHVIPQPAVRRVSHNKKYGKGHKDHDSEINRPLGPKKPSPALQQSNRKYDAPSEKGIPKGESFETSLSKAEKESKAKSKRSRGRVTAKRGKSKVDYMQHVTGVNKNSTGEKIEKGRTDYLKSLDKK